MTHKRHVLIAGGGIGGLTTAIILAQNGIKTDLFERAPEFSDVGAGLQLSPNAMHIHAAIGTIEPIKTIGFTPKFAALRDYKSGKIHLQTPLKNLCRGRYGQDYLHIHRADLQRILVQTARKAGVTFHLGVSVENFDQTDTQVTLKTDKGAFTGDALIGADGLRSAIRSQIHSQHTPRFTGQIAWRGTVAAKDLPKDCLPPAANVWMGSHRHFVAYYLCGGTLINFIAVLERDQWTEESWSLKGNPSDLRAAFDGWDPHVTQIINTAPETYLWGLFDHAPLEHWSQGRVTLLGDAAHPMLPFMAQGAAMATEDAWVVAQKLLTTPDVSAAFTAYEAARRPRASSVQARSRANATFFHHPRGLGRTLRNTKLAVASAIPQLQHMQLDPIYGVNVVKDFPLS